MKKFLLSGVFFALVLAQFVVFRHFWLTQAGAFLIHEDPVAPADAIVVLGGGGTDRVYQGVDLYHRKFGEQIIFTGQDERLLSGREYHWAVQASDIAVAQGVPRRSCHAILTSNSTRTDAELVKAYSQANGLQSLIVVTEPSHSGRSARVFAAVFKGAGIRIMLYPVRNSWFRADTWWHSEEGVLAVSTEYMKLLYYLMKGYL